MTQILWPKTQMVTEPDVTISVYGRPEMSCSGIWSTEGHCLQLFEWINLEWKNFKFLFEKYVQIEVRQTSLENDSNDTKHTNQTD